MDGSRKDSGNSWGQISTCRWNLVPLEGLWVGWLWRTEYYIICIFKFSRVARAVIFFFYLIVVVMQAGVWDPASISGMKNDLVRYFLQIMEKGRRFTTQRSRDSEYFPQFSLILDCAGLGWKHYLSYDGKDWKKVSRSAKRESLKSFIRSYRYPSCFISSSCFWS